jgi:hypothetical protein
VWWNRKEEERDVASFQTGQINLSEDGGDRLFISDLLRAIAISRSAISCISAFLRLSCSDRTLSAATQAIWASSLNLGNGSDADTLLLFIGDDEEDDRLFNELEPIDVGLLVGPLEVGEENLKSLPQLEGNLLLLSAAVAAANGSGRPFHAELPNGLSNSIVDLEGDVEEANGSLSAENGSKLSVLSGSFLIFIPLLVMVGTAKGSSVFEANGSPNPTSLKGSSVNSSSAYRCCCDSLVGFVLLVLVLPHASKLSPVEEPEN